MNYQSAKPLLVGGPMAHNEYQDPIIDHSSWMQWIEENLVQAKEFYKELVISINSFTQKTIFKVLNTKIF